MANAQVKVKVGEQCFILQTNKENKLPIKTIQTVFSDVTGLYFYYNMERYVVNTANQYFLPTFFPRSPLFAVST